MDTLAASFNNIQERTTKQIISNLFISDNFNREFQHNLVLSKFNLTKIKTGMKLTREIIDFYILDYLKNYTEISHLDETDSEFIIISDAFLEKFFYEYSKLEGCMDYFMNIKIFEKQSILVPLKNGDSWNLIVVENSLNLVKEAVNSNGNIISYKNTGENNNSEGNVNANEDKLIISHYYFAQSQFENDPMMACERVLNLLQKFLYCYACRLYNINPVIVKRQSSGPVRSKGQSQNQSKTKKLDLSSDSIELKKMVLKPSNNTSADTGLIISNIIMEAISENNPSEMCKLVRNMLIF